MQTAIVILVVLLGILALPVVAGAVYQAIERGGTADVFCPLGASCELTRDGCTSTSPEKANRLWSSNQAWARPA
jgi:hypothetical protein